MFRLTRRRGSKANAKVRVNAESNLLGIKHVRFRAKYRSAAASRVLPMPKSNPPDAERQGSSRSNQLPTRSPVGISSYRPVVGGSRAVSTTSDTSVNVPAELLADERLKGVEPRMIELILSEVGLRWCLCSLYRHIFQ